MLPKIVAGFTEEPEKFFEEKSLGENNVLFFDGEGAGVKELREWINFALRICEGNNNYSIVIWNAGKLSVECQAILLKPLEENKTISIYLMVKKETDMLPTILSRCALEKYETQEIKEKYWGEILKLWRSGPGLIIDYIAKFEVNEAESFMSETILKIKSELSKNVNQKRLTILDLALTTHMELEQTNVNKKIALENFLLSSWRIIKT